MVGAERTKAAAIAWTRAVTIAGFVILSANWIVLWAQHVIPTFGDARVYWTGSHELVTGGDPWSATVSGWSYGSFPPTALLFGLGGILPEPVFIAAWMAATLASAVYIVRRLGLAAWWIIYPPLVFAVLLGNPIVVSMALVLAGRGILAAVIRPQQALVVIAINPRSAVWLALIGVASLLVMPYWISEASAIAARYTAESGPPVNAWGSWWFVPMALALLALARKDVVLAAWLAPMALGPAAGWYSATALMLTREPLTALLGGVPVAGAMSLAAVVASRDAVGAALGSMRRRHRTAPGPERSVSGQ